LLHRGEPVRDEPAARLQQAIGALQGLAADRVQHNVVGRQVFPPTVAAVVDGAVDAQLGEPLMLAGRRGAVDLRTGGLGQLDCRYAHAAGRRVDQHPLAGPQRSVAVQRRPRGGVVDRYRGALVEAQRVGQWHGIGRLHVDDLCVAAEPGAGEYPLPHPRGIDPVADGLDGPGHLVADDGGRLRRVGIEPDAGEVVGEVDPRGAHRDAYLPWAGRRRVRTFLHLQD
jgi:hypothetical protein